MQPVWEKIDRDALEPYRAKQISSEQALQSASGHVRTFMLKQARPKDVAMVAVSQDRLFCLAVARAFVAGKPSFETQAGMQRFSAGISAALKDQYPK